MSVGGQGMLGFEEVFLTSNVGSASSLRKAACLHLWNRFTYSILQVSMNPLYERPCLRQLLWNPFHVMNSHGFLCWLPMLQPTALQWTNPLWLLLLETALESTYQALSCLSSFAHFINKNCGFMSRSSDLRPSLFFWKATLNCCLVLKHPVSFS